MVTERDDSHHKTIVLLETERKLFIDLYCICVIKHHDMLSHIVAALL